MPEEAGLVDVDKVLLKACLNWQPGQKLEDTPELQEWLREHPRNVKVVRVFEDLLKRERIVADRQQNKEKGNEVT